jgi:hypothetical protein
MNLLTRVAMVFDPAIAPFASYYLNPFKAAAASFGMEAIVAPVDDMAALERVNRLRRRIRLRKSALTVANPPN